MKTRFGAGSRTFLLRGGEILDPEGEASGRRDILVTDGTVTEIGQSLKAPSGVPALDIAGCFVSPGFLDMHVHLREPGQEDKETIETGTRAAASGGFTAVACMPNTVPPIDNVGTLEFVARRAEQVAHAVVHPVAAITMGQQGRQLTELGELAAMGAVAFSDDGRPVADAQVFRRAMEYLEAIGKPILSHAEDLSLSAGGVMNEGELSVKLGLKGIPAISEELGVVRDLLLSQRTRCRIHICHVSTAGAVDAIRRAKAAGVPVTAEATPHHFTLSESAVVGYRTEAKMNPPLRTESDVDAVILGLSDGTLDVIATDHAPHTAEEKEAEFDRAPFGIIGLETALGLAVTRLVRPGHLSYAELVRKLCANPRRILGLGGRAIAGGGTADLTVWNPEARWVVTNEEIRSRSSNTPFLGRELSGRAVLTVSAGKVTYWRDNLAPVA